VKQGLVGGKEVLQIPLQIFDDGSLKRAAHEPQKSKNKNQLKRPEQ
jgi:hypothetical protein